MGWEYQVHWWVVFQEATCAARSALFNFPHMLPDRLSESDQLLKSEKVTKIEILSKKKSFPTKSQCLFINQYLLLRNVYNLTAAALYRSFHVPIGIIFSPPSNPTTDFKLSQKEKGTGCNYNPICCSSDYWNVDISLKWAAFPHQTRNQEILISFLGKKADVNFFFHPSFLLPTDLGKS